MKKVINAYSKINLSLDVLGKRDDGYHDLRSVMQTVSLCDEITIETDTCKGISVSSDKRFLPLHKKNTAYNAAELFYSEINKPKSVHIHIKKNVPTGAGMGGGSADAAAVLRGLNGMYSNPVTEDRLLAIGLLCGADVPFCMTGGTALAEGLGEVLTPLPQLPDCIILIAKPRLSLSTKSIYRELDAKPSRMHPNTDGIIENLGSGNLPEISVRAYNVFEDCVRPQYKELDKIKGIMLDCGALGSSMTGTGSAVFGIFTDEETANTAAAQFKRNKIQAFVTTPVRKPFI